MRYVVKGFKNGQEPPMLHEETATMDEATAIAMKANGKFDSITVSKRVGRRIGKPWKWHWVLQPHWGNAEDWTLENSEMAKCAVQKP
jgi:hypothetical protein